MGGTAYISTSQGTGQMAGEPTVTDTSSRKFDPEESEDSQAPKDASILSSSKDISPDNSASPPKAPPRGGQKISPEEEEGMFRSLQEIFTQAEEDEGNFNVQELLASLEQAAEDARRGLKNLQALQGVRTILDRLWSSGSEFMARAAETLANGSRDREFPHPLSFYFRNKETLT